ncbi:hypothetical protein GCM10010307_57340 [Streptomyces vastus]|uniref:Uncharacterized protein n=1 Tax=Streptomyces vastus TaxID=285451 RepID=A0ABN3RCB7_9ACTN
MLTAITLAMFWDVPVRPKGRRCCPVLCGAGLSCVPGPEERELPVEDRLVLLGVPPLGEGDEGVPAAGGPA